MAHSIDIREEAGVRYLHFGTDWVQGAMRLAKPNHLVLAYTQEMLSFLLFREVPRRVLMIGLGAGSLVRFFRHRIPDAHCTVIEINPSVIAMAHQFFRLPPTTSACRSRSATAATTSREPRRRSTRSSSTATIITPVPAGSSRWTSIAPAVRGSLRRASW